ncbi:MAG: hypothetical protein II038_16195, partial [Lachnospiraceae bacterium]|nr:hypothetical protein [Lachnospiraceae bacterium]
MKQKSDALIGYQGANPFSDIQPRSFSDEKVSKEFYPTSVFWSLFNDQHEVLIGRRGSGKTFLLKMMRQSMLKTIRSPLAEKLVREKQYVAFYVPMQLEIVSHFRSLEDHANDNLVLFNYFFNSILAESILSELKTFFTDDSDTSIETEIKLAREICSVWFGSNDHIARIHTLDDIIDRVRSMYYAYDLDRGDLSTIPSVFRREICTPLVAITKIIARTLQLNDPTFIVCVDEAEFLNENMLKCINTVFRSNKDRIVLKVATLPFYYSTTKTLAPNCSVAAGHDFEYCLVDIAYDSEDYTQLTNKLCEYRIASRTPDIMVQFSTLEDFLGCVGKDALIDYYRAEFGKEIATRETIEAGIINSFSESRRQGANEYPQRRKTIYDKFAPIYFVRQMYLRS